MGHLTSLKPSMRIRSIALFAALRWWRLPIREEKNLLSRLEYTLRGRNAIVNIFELWVGMAGILSGIIFFVDPLAISGNVLSKQIGFGLAVLWNILYFICGFLIWYGLLRPSPRWEVVGLLTMGSVTAINGVSIISFFGLRGVATASISISLSVAAWVRGIYVFRAVLKWAEHVPR